MLLNILNQPMRKERLHAHAKYIRTALADLGYDVSGGSEQIIALEAGSEKNVLSLKNHLEERNIGLYLLLSSYYKEKSKIRMAANANLSENDLDRIVDAFSQFKSNQTSVM